MLQIFSRSSLFDKIAKYSLGAILVLLPILFSPVAGFGIASAKYVALYILTAVATLAYLLARVGDKKAIMPNMRAIVILGALPVVSLLSALFTGRFSDSFIGNGFEPTTTVSILIFVTLSFLASVYAREEKTVAKAFKLMVVTFGIVMIYQIIRLFVPADWVTLGTFSGVYANMLGKWNDIAIYVGMFVLALFVTLKTTTKKKLPMVLTAGVVLLLLLNVVSFTLIWPVLAIFALWMVVADSVSDKKITLFKKGGFTTYRTAGIVFAAVVLMYMVVATQAVRVNTKGGLLRPNLYNVVNFVPNLFGGTPNEVRPSIAVTAGVWAKEIKQNPAFGIGPNRFTESWVQNRPVALFQTPYWNSDFAFAFGYIPTLAIMTGLLGTIALLAFVLCVFWRAVKVTLNKEASKKDTIVAYLTAYLLVLSIFYVPATPLLVYMFFGIGYLFSIGKGTEMSFDKGMLRTMLFVKIAFLVLFFGAVGVALAKEYIAASYYVKSSLAISQEKNIDNADNLLQKAIKTRAHDLYYRGYADLAVLKSQVIINNGTKDGATLSDGDKQAALEQITIAKKYADAAIANYPQNYINYLFAASIYESDPTQSEKAVDLYNKSLAYNPSNPDAYFGIAKVKASKGDLAGTKEYIQKALDIRPLHTPSLLAAAQITAQDKDVEGTIGLLARAYQSDTSRGDILLNIANLQYDGQKDIKAATQTLEYAVGTNPDYIDGRYALSILYTKQGKYEDAANLLVGVIKLDEKTKTTLDPIIEKLRAGKDPFISGSTGAAKATTTAAKATSTPVKK